MTEPPSRTTHLTELQLGDWRRDGYVHVPGVITGKELDYLRDSIDNISRLYDGERGVMQHFERTVDGARICRSERLIEAHSGLADLINGEHLLGMAGELLGEPAVLYKEKVNYKLAGGAGFAPHQDAPAYPFIATHLTCMIAIDSASPSNGCLEMVAARHDEVLPMDDAGCIRPDLADAMVWTPISVEAGDLLWFHSYTPHRSSSNTSPHDRRAVFCTYNAQREGDLRQAYYDEKMAQFTGQHEGHHTRVSLIGDFRGVAPTADEIAEYRSSRDVSGRDV